jgi:hypothetical protein
MQPISSSIHHPLAFLVQVAHVGRKNRRCNNDSRHLGIEVEKEGEEEDNFRYGKRTTRGPEPIALDRIIEKT